MIKTVLLTGALALVALPAAADVCVWSPKAAAEAAVKLLPRATIIMEFCASCGDKMAKGIYVVEATSEKVPDQTDDYFFTKVNGEERDLANVFILGGRNKKEWVNLGLQVKCDTDPTNFDTKVLASKFVPKIPVLPPSR